MRYIQGNILHIYGKYTLFGCVFLVKVPRLFPKKTVIFLEKHHGQLKKTSASLSKTDKNPAFFRWMELLHFLLSF